VSVSVSVSVFLFVCQHVRVRLFVLISLSLLIQLSLSFYRTVSAVQDPALQKTLSGSERSCTDGSTVRTVQCSAYGTVQLLLLN
jgi:hypothetical protein